MEEEEAECPVCMEAYEASGPRTKVRPFLCEDGIAHAVCSACDRTLYVRQDDRCPICRAGRSGSSVARNGPRPISLPPPMEIPSWLLSMGGSINHRHGTMHVPDVLGWLPRRVLPDGQRIIDGAGANTGVLTSIAGGYGGRAFYPIDPVEDAPPADLAGGFIAAYQLAAAERRRRSEPLDLAIDAAADADDELSGVEAAFLARFPPDPRIEAALDGLTNLPGTSVIDFAQRVQGAYRRAAQRGRATHAG